MAAPLVLAGGAWFGTAKVALAYPTPSCSVTETSGSATTASGATGTFTFQVLDSSSAPVVGATITFTKDNTAGSLDPTSTTTNSSGDASTAFTAGTDVGDTVHITAADAAGCSGTAATLITSGGGNGGVQGITTGTTLPNTSTGAPGTNGVLYLGLGLALMVLIGGAVTLRRSRTTAS